MRFADVGLIDVDGFAVPVMMHWDDELWVIEMTTVRPPFIVDFASARIDQEPDLIEDEGYTLDDMIRERFDDRAEAVMAIRDEMIVRAGVYLWDFHR